MELQKTVNTGCVGEIITFGGCSWGGGETESYLVLRPLIGPLYQPLTTVEYGPFDGMRIGRGTRNTRRKLAPMPICPPLIPHDLTWDRTRRLTA
jgi:hypothetical protein